MATNINIGGRHHNFSLRRWISGRGKWHESEDRDSYEARKSVPKEVRADLQPDRYAGRRTKTYEGSGYQFRPREKYRTPGWESYHDQIDNPSPRSSRGLDLVAQLMGERGSGGSRSAGRNASVRRSGGSSYSPEISGKKGDATAPGAAGEDKYKKKYKELKKSMGERTETDAFGSMMSQMGSLISAMKASRSDPGPSREEQEMSLKKARDKEIKKAKKKSRDDIKGKVSDLSDADAAKLRGEVDKDKVDPTIDKIAMKMNQYRAAKAEGNLGAMSSLWKELEGLGANMDELRGPAPKTTTPTAATSTTATNTQAPGQAAADVGGTESSPMPDPVNIPERRKSPENPNLTPEQVEEHRRSAEASAAATRAAEEKEANTPLPPEQAESNRRIREGSLESELHREKMSSRQGLRGGAKTGPADVIPEGADMGNAPTETREERNARHAKMDAKKKADVSRVQALVRNVAGRLPPERVMELAQEAMESEDSLLSSREISIIVRRALKGE